MVTAMGCYVIAEAGVNHNGSVELAMKMVEVAAAAGADAVKFQTFTADALVLRGTETAAYQKVNAGVADQYELLKELELPIEAYAALAQRCGECGIEFLSTPFDETAADMLVGLGMRRIKVPSGEVTNHPFLRHLAALDLPILLSTGMSTMEEVRAAVEVIAGERARRGLDGPLGKVLTVLHCTSCYPTAPEDANLLAIRTMANELGLPVGYSDHTEGTAAAVAAVALGARVVEKHFTLDRALPGPDHAASIVPEELAHMVRQIRLVERALGDGRKQPRPSEEPVRRLVRRSLVLREGLPAGTVLGPEHFVCLRPATGISPSRLREVVGRRLARELPGGHILQWADLAP